MNPFRLIFFADNNFIYLGMSITGFEPPPCEPFNVFLKWRGFVKIEILSFSLGIPHNIVFPTELVSL